MPDAAAAAASYLHCRRITRAAARNFYYAIFLLPHPKRDALCALYAFMRHADDISDTPGDISVKLAQMAEWRAALDRALGGDFQGNPVWTALADTVERFQIPKRYLHDLISGTEMDLSITRYPTFAALREYCYRVAGTVGLCCIHVFGFKDAHAPELAEKLGIAFQLTNILRDVAADAAMGRVYLPLEDLQKFGVSHHEFEAGRAPRAEVLALMRFEIERAWSFYDEGWRLLSLVECDSRPALTALVEIYSGILEKIEARGGDVFSLGKVRLSAWEKTFIMLRAWARSWIPGHDSEAHHRHRRRSGGTLVGRRAG